MERWFDVKRYDKTTNISSFYQWGKRKEPIDFATLQ